MKTVPEPQRSQTINRIIDHLARAEQRMRAMEDQYWGRYERWESWFAWRPVTTASGERLWWRKIYRKIERHYDGVDTWETYTYGTEFDILKDA